VSSVKYELGFYTTEDDILPVQCRQWDASSVLSSAKVFSVIAICVVVK
jgi:hypothetical protein